jgi:hypothetical protein
MEGVNIMRILCNNAHEAWLLRQLASNNAENIIIQQRDLNAQKLRQTTYDQGLEVALDSLCNRGYKQGMGCLPTATWINEPVTVALCQYLRDIATGKTALNLTALTNYSELNTYIEGTRKVRDTDGRLMASTDIDVLLCYVLLGVTRDEIAAHHPALSEHVSYYLQQLPKEGIEGSPLAPNLQPGDQVLHPQAVALGQERTLELA